MVGGLDVDELADDRQVLFAGVLPQQFQPFRDREALTLLTESDLHG
jgi:hypothetical protein